MTKYAKIFLDKRTYANQIINLSWPNIYNFILNLVEFFTHLFSLTNRQYRRLLNYIWKVLFTILEVTLEKLCQYLNKYRERCRFVHICQRNFDLNIPFFVLWMLFSASNSSGTQNLVLTVEDKSISKKKEKKKTWKLGWKKHALAFDSKVILF